MPPIASSFKVVGIPRTTSELVSSLRPALRPCKFSRFSKGEKFCIEVSFKLIFFNFVGKSKPSSEPSWFPSRFNFLVHLGTLIELESVNPSLESLKLFLHLAVAIFKGDKRIIERIKKSLT